MASSDSFRIAFDTPRHKRIVAAIRARKVAGEQANNKRVDKWRKAEDQFLAYLPEKEEDARRRSNRELGGTPEFTTVVIPYSLATLLAAHTYWCSVFLSRSPIFQYDSLHGAAENSVLAVEALMNYQAMAGEMLIPLYNWLFQPGKYGQGILGLRWDSDYEMVSSMEEKPETILGIPIPGRAPKKVRVIRRVPGYTGNRLFNVRPERFLFDPRVPISSFQSGEFAGHITDMGWNELVKGEADGDYFNLDQLRKMKNRTAPSDYGSGQVDRVDNSGGAIVDMSTENIVDLGRPNAVVMVIELIPNDWELGESKLPEKWIFILAEDQVIIYARPFGMMHGKFPYFVLEYELDPFALFNRSMLEVISPLQNTLDFLFNSRMFNVRSSINNMLVYDPTKIVAKDILDPKPGMRIRLRPEAYGTKPQDAVWQIPVADITQGHMNDARVVLDFIQRATGVNDNIMGAVNTGGRKSATEVRSSSSFGINRLKTQAEIMSAQGWDPLSYAMLKNTQQFYDDDKMFKIAGDVLEGKDPFTQQPLSKYIKVTPDMIGGSFGWVPVDGTMPIDRYAQANLLMQGLVQGIQIPGVPQGYALADMWGYILRLGGLKNVNRFRVQVVPDQVAEQQAQAGNLIPQRGPSPNPTGNVVPLPRADGQPSDVPQNPGIGRTM